MALVSCSSEKISSFSCRTVGPSSNGFTASNSPSYASFSFPKLNGSPTRTLGGGGGYIGTPVDTVLDRYGRTGPAATALHGGSSAFMFNPMGQARFYHLNHNALKLAKCCAEERPETCPYFLPGSYNEHQRGDHGEHGGRGGAGCHQLGRGGGGQAEAAVAASDRAVLLPREEPAADPEQASDARAAQDVRRGLQDGLDIASAQAVLRRHFSPHH